MVYSKEILKIHGHKASPCLKPFLIRNMWDKCLSTWILQMASFRHIFISLYQIHGDTKLNESIIQDLHPIWIIGFLEVYK